MKRHVILAAVLVGLAGLTACAGASEGLTSGSTPPATVASASSAGATDSATPTIGAPSTSGASQRASTVPTPTNTIPEAYRGHWNTRLADCRGDSGEGKLVVEARTMTFYESVGRVSAVTRQGDRISVTLKLSGEGQTWQDTRTWALSPNGATLTDVTNGGTRSRCP